MTKNSNIKPIAEYPIPVMSDDFMMAKSQLPEYLPIIRTIMGPEADEAGLREIMKLYEQYLEQTGVYISRPDRIARISGLRQVILCRYKICEIRVVAVTDDGRFIHVIVNSMDAGNPEPISLAEIIKVFSGRNDKWNTTVLSSVDENTFRDIKQFFLTRHEPQIQLEEILHHRFGNEIKAQILKQALNDALDCYRQGWNAILEVFDRDIRKVIEYNKDTYHQDIVWLTGGDGAAPETILARKQALCAYPILTHMFLYKDIYLNLNHLKTVIDNRDSLSGSIADKFRVDVRRVRRIQGVTWYQGNCHPASNEHVARMILDIPDGYVPQDWNDYQRLQKFNIFLNVLYRKHEHAIKGPHASDHWIFMFNYLSGNRISPALMDRAIEADGTMVLDGVRFLAEKLFLPAMLNRVRGIVQKSEKWWNDERHKDCDVNRTCDKLMAMILEICPLKALLELSRRYHRNIFRYAGLLETVSVERKWKPLLGAIDFGNGYIAHELVSSRTLKIQGTAQKHCAGGYVQKILESTDSDNACLVFSIEQNGKILSTVEFLCKGAKKPDVRVEQNKGYGNVEPVPKTRELASRIARKIEHAGQESLSAWRDGLRNVKAEYAINARVSPFVERCGFNPFNPALLEQAWAELSPMLPRGIRHKGFNGLIKRMSDISLCKDIELTNSDKANLWERIDKDGFFI